MKNNFSYIKPKHTYQEMLSNNDIKEKLKDYKKVNDITKINIGSHIRYFIKDKNNKELFRLGGTLQKIDPQYRYISLNNGSVTWSVQLNNSILYQKMTEDEIKAELKNELKNEILTETNQSGGYNINNYNNLKNAYNNLEKEYKNLQKKNESLQNRLNKIENEIKKKL
jgi:chromosome segregation ATPase